MANYLTDRPTPTRTPAKKNVRKPVPSVKKAAPGPTTKIDTYRTIRELLRTNGVPEPAAGFAAAAVAHETGDFTSRVSARDNNYSGIKFINKPYQVATKGSPAPEGGNYAHFASRIGWAKDYSRILHLKPGEPYKATSLADFARRLKMNKYYADTEANYLRGMTAFYNKYTPLADKREIDVQKGIKETVLQQNDRLSKELQKELEWGKFKDKYLTPRNLAIGAGVLIAGLLIANRR